MQRYSLPGETHELVSVIRAKDGNLSIPLYVSSETTTTKEDAAEYRANGLPTALSAWLESSAAIRQSLADLLFAAK